jgi:hypothetical protein
MSDTTTPAAVPEAAPTANDEPRPVKWLSGLGDGGEFAVVIDWDGGEDPPTPRTELALDPDETPETGSS